MEELDRTAYLVSELEELDRTVKSEADSWIGDVAGYYCWKMAREVLGVRKTVHPERAN